MHFSARPLPNVPSNRFAKPTVALRACGRPSYRYSRSFDVQLRGRLGGKIALTAAEAEIGRRNESRWSWRKPLAAALDLDLGRALPTIA
jgi:hypothetical protein